MSDEIITQPLGTELLSTRKQRYEIRNQNASRLLNLQLKNVLRLHVRLKRHKRVDFAKPISEAVRLIRYEGKREKIEKYLFFPF